MEPIIFHVDVNSAFLSWEAVYRLKHQGGRLDLRTIPSAVGGDVAKRRGIILAKSIPAKAYDVKTGETVSSALKKCPKLVLVPPNYNMYQRASDALMELLRAYTPLMEQYSIDEAYMDMTGCCGVHETALKTAEKIRSQVLRELGFTVNIGVAENKLLAKMASDFEKPDRLHTLFRDEIPVKLWPLPAADLFFIGRATEKKLRRLGIATIGELAGMDSELMRSHFGKYGQVIWDFANGLDSAGVEGVPPPNKGYGNSTTTALDVSDPVTAKLVLLSLAETLGGRLRKDGVNISVVAVGIRDIHFEYHSHQITLKTATNLTLELHEAACRVFDEAWDGTPIRHLGIHTGRVSQEEGRQLRLFDRMDYEKLGKLDKAVDEIRSRYGSDSVMRASFLPSRSENSPVFDHMGGGVAREKRTVDYGGQQIL